MEIIGNRKSVVLKHRQATSAGWSLAMAPAAPTCAGGVLGTSVGTLVAVPRSMAVQWTDGRRPDLSPLGSKGREACRLCKGREAATGCRLILVSAFMWHTGAHETQAGTGGVVVSVQSTRRTPGRVMGLQHLCNRLLVTPSRLRLQGRIDPPKGGTVQERRSLVRARLLRSEPRQCPNDRRDQGAG